MLKILSLGAGVQSTTLLLMSCEGVLPKLDHAIFADTGWEPQAVYAHLGWLEQVSERAGIPVHRVHKGSIREDALKATVRGLQANGERRANIPYYTRNPDGSIGAVRRQCTKEYKIEPIERFIRRNVLGLAPGRGAKPDSVELWMGISADEQRRVRISKERWKTHRFPLIFDLPQGFRRHDCLNWLQERGYPLPPRSSCIGCPFHSDAEWRAVKADPEAWEDVTEFDAAIRNRGGMRGQLFLHRSAQPLVQIDLSTPEDRGQQSMNWNEECTGYCGT